ncbi:MAG: methyl-accepting chemotaxis protein [Rhodocyclaceae bacterium]|nr:methyl-accepting chemotaxis protein [Rhodocyclaceae bacterium]
MFGSSLRARFIVPVSLFVVVFVIGGALWFASLESRRIEGDLAADAEKQLQSVTQVLSVTDTLMMAQTHALMRLLVERGEALGPAAPGAAVQVGDKTVPNLMLGSRGQANNFDLVDGVVAIGGGTATLFVKSGDEFVRVATNVKRDNGTRAIGTILDPKGKAIAAIRDGKAFYGVVDILGSPYITGYAPIRDARGETVGIWYVGYKADLSVVKDAVEKGRLLQNGFVAIVDGKGAVRFRSGHVTDEQVLARIKDTGGWKTVQREFAPWGFTAVASYPVAEAEAVSRERMVSIIVAGVLACAVLIAMMSILLQRLVLTPLGGEPSAAAEAAARIAAGDLASEVATRPGDTQSMMAAIARMREALRGMVASILQGAAALNTAAENLVTMSDRVSDGVGQQNDATASIAATLEEITVSIRHVADSAQLANEMARTAGDLSSEGNRSVGEVVSAMQRSAESVNESAAVIDRLGEASRKITAIVNVIKEIADQTNLLALNAAIEAARAGEAGRGFAVVADEVRKLAERTALSTQEITAMIGDIQSSTSLAISGIDDGAELVNGSVERATVAGESMRSIHEATERVVNAVGEISLALKEQSSASEIISRNVEQVANMNESNTSAVRNVVDDAHQLQALAAQLKQTVGSFRV